MSVYEDEDTPVEVRKSFLTEKRPSTRKKVNANNQHFRAAQQKLRC